MENLFGTSVINRLQVKSSTNIGHTVKASVTSLWKVVLFFNGRSFDGIPLQNSYLLALTLWKEVILSDIPMQTGLELFWLHDPLLFVWFPADFFFLNCAIVCEMYCNSIEYDVPSHLRCRLALAHKFGFVKSSQTSFLLPLFLSLDVFFSY